MKSAMCFFTRSGFALVLVAALALGLIGMATSVNAQIYGNGSNGNFTVSGTYHVTSDRNYQNLTVNSGSTLETHGYIIRVAGTLTNNGTITDSYSGGGGRSEVSSAASNPGSSSSGNSPGSNGFVYWTPTTVCYVDADGDGYGDANDTGTDVIGSCGGGFSTYNSDCDDSNPNTHPGAPEICDGQDNNCDSNIPADELDQDGDGWRVCDGDCDDADPNVYPGNTETMCNGIDDDCDPGTVDDEDPDSDGVSFCAGDNCPNDPNPGQADLDLDGIGDVCDPVCCLSRGDIDHMLNGIDIADLVYLVDYMFNGSAAPICLGEADLNGDGAIDIADLVYLVDFMFTGGPPPVGC